MKRRETNNPRDIHDNVDNYVDKCITLTEFFTRSAMASTVSERIKIIFVAFQKRKNARYAFSDRISEE